MTEQHRPTRLDPDRQGGQREHGRAQNQQHRRAHNVYNAANAQIHDLAFTPALDPQGEEVFLFAAPVRADPPQRLRVPGDLAFSAEREGLAAALREVATAPGEVILPGEWEKARTLIAAGTDINYEGATGGAEFDANGDVPGAFVEMTLQGGAFVEVGPAI